MHKTVHSLYANKAISYNWKFLIVIHSKLLGSNTVKSVFFNTKK